MVQVVLWGGSDVAAALSAIGTCAPVTWLHSVTSVRDGGDLRRLMGVQGTGFKCGAAKHS